MGDLLDEQHALIWQWLLNHGVPSSSQLTKRDKKFVDMDLHDFCSNLLSSAVNPTESDSYKQIRNALLCLVPSDLITECAMLACFPVRLESPNPIKQETEEFASVKTAQSATGGLHVNSQCYFAVSCVHMIKYTVQSEEFKQSRAMVAADTDEKVYAMEAKTRDGKLVNTDVAKLKEDQFTVTGPYLAIQYIASIRNRWMHFKCLSATQKMVVADFQKDVRGLVLCAKAMGFNLPLMRLHEVYRSMSELLTWHALLFFAVIYCCFQILIIIIQISRIGRH